jgi:tetratricopeptide (TPR) repeat protein
MLAKKNSFRGAMLVLALAVLTAGCTPAGPRALLNGKKYLDRGAVADAVAQLKIATQLLPTNAQAWNYYGVALQLAGQPDDAATAYQNALKYDRDLIEAHFNYGSLALEQNKAELARTEFSAYTLRRQNDAAGWLKLGSAQLKAGDVTAAERSFSTVLALKQFEAEAYNGLGLARVQRSLPQDAEKFFTAAMDARPNYAAAILNRATVEQQYLHDTQGALDHYKKYIALAPRPANADEVSAIVNGLETAQTKLAVATPVEKTAPPVLQTEPRPETKPAPKISNVVTQRSTTVTRPLPVKVASANPTPVEVVQVRPEQTIVTTPVAPVVERTQTPVQQQPVEAPMPADQPKKGFWGRLFGGSPDAKTPQDSGYHGEGLTPLPNGTDTGPKPVVIPPAKPIQVVEPAPVFARYNYFNPRKPAAGDRTAANGAFTKARLAEQDGNETDALQWYQQAAAFDPSWFEAQYNTGVLAHRLRNFALSLPRYELALAIQPDSADARYNFALALKAAGYAPDAVDQLKKILSSNPNEVRAHLALANICAQQLRDNAQARVHYQKVLDLDPQNEQASNIGNWLMANPK